MPTPRAQADFAETAPAFQIQELQQGARHWRSIFSALMALMAVLVWTAFVEHSGHEHQLALQRVAQRDANLATAVDLYAVRVFRNARAVHQFIGSAYRRDPGEARLVESLRDRLRANDAFVELAVCMADGRILSALGGASLLHAADCSTLAAATQDATEITVGTPLATGGGVLLVPLTLPVAAAGGQRAGVAVALTPTATLLGVMASARLHEETTVVLVGDDGRTRAAWHSEDGPVGSAEAADALGALRTAGEHGQARIEGKTQLISVRPQPTWNLQVVVATAQDDALAPFHQRRLLYLAVCILVSVAILAVYLVLTRLQAQSTLRAKSLSRARTQLQLLNQHLDAQVQERTAQLRQAYTDLESFSYTIAHDVRAPLAAISAFARELEPVVSAAGSDKHAHYLQRIQANAAQMNELTQRLLELGQLTRAPLKLTQVDLSAIAREVLARLRDADDTGREVEVRVRGGLTARADAPLVRQLLENLLGNAWKFSAGRAPARITVDRLDTVPAAGWQTFMVADNGAGFDSKEAPGLFQPFRRMHAASEFPGTGVGLATVQRIVKLHGGQVWSDARPGAGATFYFTLRTVDGA